VTLLLLPLLLAAQPAPTWPPLAQRLYFRRGGAVAVYDLAAQREQVLWPEREAGNDDPPSASADGAVVFFSLAGNLWAMPAGGGRPTRLTSLGGGERGRCERPLPAPDRRWVAYCFRPGQGPAQVRCVRPDGRDDHLLAVEGEPPYAWSPSGTYLVFARGGRLWRCVPQQPEPTALTTAGEQADSAPRFLPDGRLLLRRGSVPSVLASDGQVTPATPRGLDATRVVPSPDGQRLALVRFVVDPRESRHGWTELHVTELRAARSRLVLSTHAPTSVVGRVALLGWHDRAHLLVLRDLNEPFRKVYRLDVATSAAELVFKAQHQDDGFAVWP